MKNIILLVFGPEDVSAIPSLLQQLSPPKNLWCIHNPSLGVNVQDAAREVEANIAALEKDKSDAVKREDYAAAANIREKIQEAKVNRDIAVRDAYAKIPQEQLTQLWDVALAPLADWCRKNVANATFTANKDVHQPEEAFTMLGNYVNSWPVEDFPHGEYSIEWPRNYMTVKQEAQPEAPITRNVTQVKKVKENGFTAEGLRRETLAKKHFAFIAAVQQHQFPWKKGEPKPPVIDAILAAEFPRV